MLRYGTLPHRIQCLQLLPRFVALLAPLRLHKVLIIGLCVSRYELQLYKPLCRINLVVISLLPREVHIEITARGFGFGACAYTSLFLGVLVTSINEPCQPPASYPHAQCNTDDKYPRRFRM